MSLFQRNIGPLTNFIPPRRRPMSRRPQIVLVHGFGTTPRSLTPMVDHFEGEGLACSVPSVGGVGGLWQTNRVARAGARLAEYLRGLPPGVTPWVIGHSIGGIIARTAVQLNGVASRIRGLITLGSPHEGTPVAVAGFLMGFGLLSRAPLDISPISGLLRELNRAPWPSALPLLSVVSHSDLLCPIRSGTPRFGPTSAVRTIALSSVGHTEMVRIPWVLNALLALMNDPDAVIHPIGPPDAPPR